MDFLNSDFSAASAKNSGAMKKIMSDKKVANVLSSDSQRKNFYETLKKYKGSNNPLQKALGEMDMNKNDGISSSAADRIKRTMGISIDRSAYRNQKNTSEDQGRSPYVAAPRQANIPTQPSARPQLSQTFTKRSSGLMNSGLVVKR